MEKDILEIFKNLLLLNATGKYTIFFDVAGHTRTFDIRIYKGKWSRNKKAICYLTSIHYDSPEYKYYEDGTFKSFDPENFRNYLIYLFKNQTNKKCSLLEFSNYDK